jgi:adenine phosphoribosyltransferase
VTGSRAAARDVVLERFAWIDGHANIWPIFRDGAALRVVVDALAQPYAADGITAVCGIESRGFLLGGAVAVRLGTGFVPIRKPAGIFPGPKISRTAAPDYLGNSHQLRMQLSPLGPADRVLLVDDWIETGSQASAARQMVIALGAQLVGCSVIVDDMADQVRADIGRVHALVTADDLPSGEGS